MLTKLDNNPVLALKLFPKLAKLPSVPKVPKVLLFNLEYDKGYYLILGSIFLSINIKKLLNIKINIQI